MLTKARELVANDWCAGIRPQNAKGETVHNYSPEAVRFPAWAALDAAFCNPVHRIDERNEKVVDPTGKAHDLAKTNLIWAAKHLHGAKAIVENISDKGQAQALEMLDAAIERRKEIEEANMRNATPRTAEGMREIREMRTQTGRN